MPIDAKHLSEPVDLGRQAIFLDDLVRPHATHELVFAEDPAARVDEGDQGIERPTAQLDRSAIGQQLAAMADDPEPTKVNRYGIFGLPSHGPDCRPGFTTFQNESRWAKDSWGTSSLRCAPRSVTTT
jgi:hypothetical protein